MLNPLVSEDIVAKFMENRSFEPDDVAGECHPISKLFVYHCAKNGIRASLIGMGVYIGSPFVNIHHSWKGIPILAHWLAQVGDQVYDFTVRQFDPDLKVPLIEDVSVLDQRWKVFQKDDLDHDVSLLLQQYKEKQEKGTLEIDHTWYF